MNFWSVIYGWYWGMVAFFGVIAVERTALLIWRACN